MDRIGVICEPDHPVFGPVAERLAARGFEIEFLPPGEPADRDAIDGLAALVNAHLGARSFAALRYADRNGVETWNGFVPTTALSCRLLALHALERVGCEVPSVWFERPETPYFVRARYAWDGPVEAAGSFYQEQIGTDPEADRYYAVDDGVDTHVKAMTVRSELTNRGRLVEETDVTVELATRVRELLDRFGARAVAVEFVRDAAGVAHAVDVDVTPAFRETGMERHVADSVASLTTIGA